MEPIETEVREKPVIDKVDSLTKQLMKNWIIAKRANLVWDFRSLEKARSAYAEAVAELMLVWPSCQDKLSQDTAAEYDYVNSASYREDMEQALQAAGIPLQGTFPAYEFPPFKLSIATQELEAKLSLGRKQEKTTAMHPKSLAAWVAKQYQAVVGKKFDAAAFMRELLAAYKFANKVSYREEEVLWGRAVSLDTLYELLTLKRSSRQDYPKPLFAYELGRLKEQFDLTLDGFQFELGFARIQTKALVIVDSQGRESRVSSLTIYKAAE